MEKQALIPEFTRGWAANMPVIRKINGLLTTSSNDNIIEPIRVGTMPSPDGTIKGGQAMRVYSIDGKAVAIKGQAGGSGAKTGLYAEEVEPLQKANIYMVKDGFITVKGRQYPIKLKNGWYLIRKLTVNECRRLQTVPDWFEFPVSNSQAYKLLGNGWTCEVIAHLIKSALENDTEEKEAVYTQMRIEDFLGE